MKKSIRIVLTVSEVSPELYAALVQVPERLRAERVRTLSTIGLLTMNGGFSPKAVAVDKPAGAGSETSTSSNPSKALDAARRLGGLE